MKKTYSVAEIEKQWKCAQQLSKSGDVVGAAKAYTIVGEMGFADGFLQAAGEYELGYKGVDKDYNKSLELYKRASEQASGILGVARLSLKVKPENPEQARECLEKLTELDHPLSQVGHYQLARFYFDEKYAERDMDRCLQHLRKAVAMGHVWATRDLGIYYASQGHRLKGLRYAFKAFFKGVWLGFVHPTDPRHLPF